MANKLNLPGKYNEALGPMINWLADLSSYTVLPDGMCGESVATRFMIDGGLPVDMKKPGIDNRSRFEADKDDVRVCVRCAVEQFMFGFSDVRETGLRVVCNCSTMSTTKGTVDEPTSDVKPVDFYSNYATKQATRLVRGASLLGCYGPQDSYHRNTTIRSFSRVREYLRKVDLV